MYNSVRSDRVPTCRRATVNALIATDRAAHLQSHLHLASLSGVIRKEITEFITHLAFYFGWPTAVSAVEIARDVLQGEGV